jgi:hypothetical protein
MERIAPRFCVDKARIVCEVGTLVEYLIMASTKTLLSTPKTHPTNAELATPLRETADLLEAQGASIRTPDPGAENSGSPRILDEAAGK